MIRKVFRQMTATQIASAAMVTVCLLTDNIIIARFLGVEAVSAYGLANPVLIMFTAQGTVLVCGIQVLTGRAMGRGDMKACGRCFSTSAVMALVMTVLWMLAIFLFTDPICYFLGTGIPSEENSIFIMTSAYLRGFFAFAPFFFLSQIMIPYLQIMAERKRAVAAVIVLTVSDIVLDLVSIFVFHAGMLGIGVAAGLSYMAAFLVGAFPFFRKDSLFRFDPGDVDVRMMPLISRSGSTIAVNQTSFTIRVYLINRMLLALSGSVAVAAFTVISTTSNLIGSIGLGAGSVTLLLASLFYSEEDRTSLYELMRGMVPYTLKLILAAVITCEAAAPLLMRLFLGKEPQALPTAVAGFRICLPALAAGVLVTVLKNYYQGTGRVKFTNLISLCDNVLITVPAAWLLSRIMGVNGVWTGIMIAPYLVLLMISLIVWSKNGRAAFTAEAYSLLRPDFGADPSDVFVLSVTDMASAIGASEEINGFCAGKGLGSRLSMLVSLCVEEVTVNIIEHGFTKDDLPHSADVRLVVNDDRCIIRIRDNCVSFDPLSYIELHSSDDPASHVGIRMVTAMVSEINYMNSLGLNNLYMKLDRDQNPIDKVGK